MVDGAIIVGGDKFVMKGIRCHTWHDHGMEYTVANTAVARRLPPRWLVYHWTGSYRDGEEGAKKIFNSLLHRQPVGLSVEFFIDVSGTIWQFADPADVRCRHCSRVNDISIGVEVSCLGAVKKGKSVSPHWPTYKSPPLRGGWKPTLYNYNAAQQAAANALAVAVCGATGIPQRVEGAPWERRPKGFFETAQGGVTGHLEAAWLGKKYPKIDPGPAPLIAIAEHFDSLEA